MRAAGLPAPSEPWDAQRVMSDPSQTSLRNPDLPLDRSASRSPSQTPADPTVLSSIISSLDTLGAPSSIQLSQHSWDTASKRPRRQASSDSGPIINGTLPDSSHPASFSLDLPNTLTLEEGDDIYDFGDASNAALPPTIRTSRPPSGFSQYIAPRTPAYSAGSKNATFRLMPDSPRNSLSIDRQAAGRNKLSAESWVKKGTPAEDAATASHGRSTPKASARVGSPQAVRRGETSPSPSPTRMVDAFASPHHNNMIATRPTTASSASRGRLYLRDSTINEDWPLANNVVPQSSPTASDSAMDVEARTPAEERSVPSFITPPRSSKSNPISDSIPTRTSSLRQPSVSPAPSMGKKKQRRQSPASGAKETKPYKPSKQIPESKWADLGEDDETVKRIRQLKEQRKSRLQSLGQIDSVSTSPSLSPTPDSRNAAGSNVGAVPSPTTPNSFKEGYLDAAMVRRPSAASGASSPIKQSLEVKTPPLSATTGLTPLKATVATASSSPKQSLDNSAPSSRLRGRPDAVRTPSLPDLESTSSEKTAPPPPPPPPPMPSFQGRSQSKKGRKSMSEKHPDASSDLERRKSRRKSIGNPQYARAWEEGMEAARRDSIDTAVSNYLDAPRLNRRVRHPVTGRVIAFSEVGDPDGAAVFVCVGMGLTRFITAFYDELAATLRLRLITIDRPGVGGSEAYPSTDKSGPMSWPGDLFIICQELGITEFSLLAHSAGAVYALATALVLRDMINGKVHLLAPWIPPSQLEVISHPTASAPPAGALPRSQRILRVLPTPLLKAANIGGSSASLRPPSKRKVTNQRPVPQFGVEPDSPDRENAPSSPPADERAEFGRRESIMLMDRYKPATNPTDNFPMDESQNGVDDVEPALRRGSLVLSATTTPVDPSFTYASKALNAAEHTARERQSEYTTRLTESTWTLATRDSHPTVDLVVCLERNRDVGFRYTDVPRDVVIHHGADDKRVPLRNVRWVAEQMNRRAGHRTTAAAAAAAAAAGEVSASIAANGNNNEQQRQPIHETPESRDGWVDAAAAHGGCEIRVLNGEGHGLMASPSIMSDVLAEIASYWFG